MISSHASRRRWSSPLPAVATAIVLALALTVPTPARAEGDAAAELTALIGAERAAAGLPALQVAGDLVDVATRHSSRMAAAGDLHHNANLSAEVANWQRLTENVGRGPDARTVHQALMASAGHAANIRDANVSQVGVGVARSGDTLWVTQVFRQPEAAPASAPPPPAPEPPRPAEPPPPPPVETAVPAPPNAPDPTPDAVPAPRFPDPAPSRPHRDEVVVHPAVAGTVQAAPDPGATRLLTAARWLVVVWLLVE